jgi:hypothetical protein
MIVYLEEIYLFKKIYLENTLGILKKQNWYGEGDVQDNV